MACLQRLRPRFDPHCEVDRRPGVLPAARGDLDIHVVPQPPVFIIAAVDFPAEWVRALVSMALCPKCAVASTHVSHPYFRRNVRLLVLPSITRATSVSLIVCTMNRRGASRFMFDRQSFCIAHATCAAAATYLSHRILYMTPYAPSVHQCKSRAASPVIAGAIFAVPALWARGQRARHTRAVECAHTPCSLSCHRSSSIGPRRCLGRSSCVA